MTPVFHGNRQASWTRFQPPREQVDMLPRTRLDDALESTTAAHRVTVLTAPSGFGKTTAVGAWARTHSGDVAWLALGPYDRDRQSLDVGVVEALQLHLREPGDAAPLLDIDPESEEDAIAYRAICRHFRHSMRPTYLVIDDAQRAGAGLSDSLLAALIENAPESLRIVLIGTTLVELELARLLLSDPGARIGADTLAFTAKEVDDLIHATPSPLSSADVLEHTQGWPIAVRLLLLGGVAPEDNLDIAEAGGDIRLREYVHRHVLGSVPTSTADFILAAAVCAETSPDVSAAVTGRDDAAELLERCAAQGLFVHRYDQGDGPIYRWNTVFARQCVGLLAATDPARLHELHERAADALCSSDPLAAIVHLLRADEHARAIEILLHNWVHLVTGMDAAAVERVCAELPAPFADDPRVLLVRACAKDVLGEQTLARSLFTRATHLLERRERLPGQQEVLMLARLFLLDDRAAVAAASADVQELLKTSPTLATSDRAAVLYLVGWAELRHRMNPQLVTEYLATAAREAVGNPMLRRRALGHLVFGYAWRGQMRRAEAVLDELEESDEDAVPWAHYASGSRAAGEAWVRYWAADLGAAYDGFLRVITAGSSRTSFGGVARLVLAAAAAATRDPRRCRRAAAELQAMAVGETQGVVWTIFRETAIACLEEVAGHRERATAIANRYSETTNVPFVAVVLAGILRRAGDPVTALHLLQNHSGYGDITYMSAATRATAALVHAKRGDMTSAHELCEAALDVAAPEGIRLPFCDGDLAMRQLLAAHLLRTTAHEEFIAECLALPRSGSPLEQLSERESDVFVLLQTAKTLTEIGDELGVSVNTVKSHQRAIYRKLGVNSRREARGIPF